RPSGDIVQDSARLGVVWPAGIGFTSASWIAYRTLNGVMADSVSPGSSQRGASVTWKAYVTWPWGPAASAVLTGTPSAQIAESSTAAATDRARNLTCGLLGGSSQLEPNVLVRRRVRVVGDQGEGRLVNLRPDTPNESVFPDRSEHDAIVEDPLDLMEQRLALL